MLMNIEKKYPFVNWADGMKINQAHFRALEDSLLEYQHQYAALQAAPFRFGLLPPRQTNTAPYGLSMDANGVEVYRCWGLTQDGIMIQVDGSEDQGLKASMQQLLGGRRLDAYPDWYLLIKARPYQRRAMGEPDQEEDSFRPPSAVTAYGLELVPGEQINSTSYLPGVLPLARITVSSQGAQADDRYIPPVVNLRASSILYERYKVLERTLLDIDNHLTAIVQKAQYKAQHEGHTVISADLLEIASHLGRYLSEQMDNYLHVLPEQSPFFFQLWFIRMARKLDFSFRYLKAKDQTFNYCTQYTPYPTTFWEAESSNVIGLRYQHYHVQPALDTIQTWVNNLEDILRKLSELHYNELGRLGIVTTPSPNPPRTTPNPDSFTIKKRDSNTDRNWGLSD